MMSEPISHCRNPGLTIFKNDLDDEEGKMSLVRGEPPGKVIPEPKSPPSRRGRVIKWDGAQREEWQK